MRGIGRAVYVVRMLRDISQKELAVASGVSDSYISLLETNKRNPNFTTVQNIAKGLGIATTLLVMLSEKDVVELKPFLPLLYSTLWEVQHVVE